jgi:ribosome-associated protein
MAEGRRGRAAPGTGGGDSGDPTPGPEVVRVTQSLRIPLSELQFRFSPSGGPGGQHANKVATRVELRFDVEGSPSLGPYQRSRLLEKLGPEVRVVVDEERSQLRNRQLAVERLRERLVAALHIEKARRPTRPSKGAKERRLAEKRRLSERKRSRRPGFDD